MKTEIVMKVLPAPERPAVAVEPSPVSLELGADLMRLEHEQRVALDRKRQEELARLRAVQSFD
jgi:hypothetical protein